MYNKFKLPKSLGLIALGVALIFSISCSDDSPSITATVAFSTATGTIAENASEPLAVTVQLSESVSTDLTVTISVTNGADTEDADYTLTPAASNGSVVGVISAGETTGSMTLMPVDNNVKDGDKTVTFTITAISEGELHSSNLTFTATITDDEADLLSLPVTEDFNACATGLPTTWSFISVASNEDWECTSDTRGISGEAGDYAVEVNGFGADAASEDWIISPKIDLGTGDKKISFYSLVRFPVDSRGIDLLISNNYDGAGDPSTATWTELEAAYDTDGGDFDYAFSGEISLASYDGGHHIAFKYTSVGTAGGEAAQWRLDQVEIQEGAPATMTVTESLTAFAGTDNGANSASQTFTVAGSNLSGDVTITATDHFEVSSDDSSYGSTATLTGVTAAQTVYVRFSPTSGFNGTIDGTITVSSDKVSDRIIAVSGEETGNVDSNLLIEENFDYGSVAGSFVNDGAGIGTDNWNAHSGNGSNPADYLTTSLTMSGYGSSGVGGSIQLLDASGSIEDINRSFGSATSGTIYAAALVSVASSASTSEFGDYFMHFKTADAFDFYSRVTIRDEAGKLRFGIREKSGTTNFSTTDFDYDVTYLVVVAYDFDNGNAYLHVLTSVPSTEPAPIAESGDDTNNATALGEIAFRGDSDNPAITIDGLRVATDWAGAMGL